MTGPRGDFKGLDRNRKVEGKGGGKGVEVSLFRLDLNWAGGEEVILCSASALSKWQ